LKRYCNLEKYIHITSLVIDENIDDQRSSMHSINASNILISVFGIGNHNSS